MSILSDYLDEQPIEAAPETPGQFGRGLRGGLRSAESSLRAFAGGAGEALGATDFAHGQYDASRAAQGEAAAEGPTITSYKQVLDSPDLSTGLRNAYDYTTGVLGGMLPQAAVAVGAGLGAKTPVGSALRAGATMLPTEAGNVIERQQMNPESLKTSAVDRFGQAVGTGAVSAGLQSVVPAGVAGKIAGRAAGGGLAGVAEAAGMGGATTAAAEAAKQGGLMLSDPNAKLDPEAIKEAGVGGAVGGGLLGGLGAGVGALRGAAPDAATKLRDTFENAHGKAKDILDRTAAGEDVPDLGPLKGADPAKAAEMMPGLDADQVDRAKQWGEDLLAKGGLSPERQDQVKAWMADAGDKVSQQGLAAMKQAQDAVQGFADKAKGLYEAFKRRPIDAESRVLPERTALKSEDFGGTEKAIAEAITPILKESQPALFEVGHETALADAGRGIRAMLEATQQGGKDAITSDQIGRLIDTFGPDTVHILDTVYKAVGSADPKEMDAFYGAINRVRDAQVGDDGLMGVLKKSLIAPDLASDAQLKEVAQHLKEHVLGRSDPNATPASAEKAKFDDARVQFELEKFFGPKTDAVLKAIEKDVKDQQKESQLSAAASTEADLKTPETKLAEREAGQLQGDTVHYGPQKGGLALHPDLDPAGDKGQAIQALARAKKENPDRSVSFLSADQLGMDHPAVEATRKRLLTEKLAGDENLTVDEATKLVDQELKKYGMVAAEGTRQETQITKNDLPKITVKGEGEKSKTSHLKNAGTLRTEDGGTVYDSVKLQELMEQKFKNTFSESDGKSALHRTARMFAEGVAALQDHLGKAFEVPDGTVIDRKGTTWGDVKGLDMSPGEGKGEGEKLTAYLDKLRKDYKGAKADGVDEKGLAKIAKDAAKAKDTFEGKRDAELARERQDHNTDEGAREADPFGNIHELGDKVEPIHTDLAGDSNKKSAAPNNERLKPAEVTALRAKFDKMADMSAAGKAVATKAHALLDNIDVLNKSANRTMFGLLAKGKNVSDAASAVNALYEKYSSQFKAEPTKPAAKAEKATAPKAIDEAFTKETYPDFKSAGEADKFLVDAYKRMGELDRAGDDSPARDALHRQFDEGGYAQSDLSSFYDGLKAEGRGDDGVRVMLKEAAPEVAAQGPKGEAEAYASTLRSQQGVDPTKGTHTAADRRNVRDHINDVLGPSVKVAFKKILHAGEFETNGVDSIIRISVHALNPMNVAYHESLHAFFSKLHAQGNSEVTRIMQKVAMSAPIQNQLRRLLAGEQAALKQLSNPEESAAYMYQFWAAKQLTVGTQTKTFFGHVADGLRKVLGIWSNDQRALEIMDYFHRGDFKANANDASAVARALVDSGRNQALEKAKSFTKPMYGMGESLLAAGGARLRDTGVPALRELADAMKLHDTQRGEDPGFLPAARTEATRVRNELAAKLSGFAKEHIAEALEAMQNGVQAASPEGRLVQRAVQGPGGLLPKMLEYMRSAGVNVAGLKIDHSYFPRVYDTSFVSRHQKEFLGMLEKYKISGQMKGDPRDVLQTLMAAEGNEFNVEVDKPGVQALKKRVLDFVSDADAAPFMRKDMYEILGSYITQATRRGEWARRFGDQGEVIGNMVARAKKQGASTEDIEAAYKYVKAIDGTLGDRLDPTARRLMGNMIVYQNIRLLPLAIFSSVVDPLGIVVRGGTVGDAFATFKRGISEVALNFKKTAPADAQTKLAQDFGVIDDAMLMHTLGATYSQGMVGDLGRKINDTYFRFNLMEQFNRSMRVGATQAALGFMARHADGTASPHSARWMAELGYEPGEYRPGMMDEKAKAAVNRWVDGAVLRPDAADKPIWMSDPHYMLFSHLKTFVYAFQQTILKRVAHEYQHGNYSPSIALAAYVPTMIAADALKGVIQGAGGTPQWKKDWGVEDYVGNGVERAGLLGVGQFAVDTATMGPLGALGGPTVGQLWDAAKVVGGTKTADSFVLHAMPANAVYGGFAKSGGEADAKFPD